MIKKLLIFEDRPEVAERQAPPTNHTSLLFRNFPTASTEQFGEGKSSRGLPCSHLFLACNGHRNMYFERSLPMPFDARERCGPCAFSPETQVHLPSPQSHSLWPHELQSSDASSRLFTRLCNHGDDVEICQEPLICNTHALSDRNRGRYALVRLAWISEGKLYDRFR